MLDHTGKISIREWFDIKIAETSEMSLKLWDNSNLELAKAGSKSTKQKIQSFKKLLDGPRPL